MKFTFTAALCTYCDYHTTHGSFFLSLGSTFSGI